MTWRWVILIIALAILGAASFAGTRILSQRMNNTPASPLADVRVLADYLELTDKQVDKLERINNEFSSVRPELRSELWRTRDELIKILKDPDSTKQDVISATREFNNAQHAMQLNTIEYIFEIRSMLDIRQRAKLLDVMGRGMCALTCGPGRQQGWKTNGEGSCGMGQPNCGGLRNCNGQ